MTQEKIIKVIEEPVKNFGYNDFFIEKMAEEIDQLIKISLKEDLNDIGDITSKAIISDQTKGNATIIAKQAGVFSGGFLIELVAAVVDSEINVTFSAKEGDHLFESQRVSKLSGAIKSILVAERTILNFISRTSGVSTLTKKFADIVGGFGISILDTRKTYPGWRYLDKYAVKVGGGANHRIGLFDMFLIKENHIKAAGSISEAVKRCKILANRELKSIEIEVETTNLKEVKEAMQAGVDRIMLDNMGTEEIKKAVEIIRGANKDVEIEISGGVNLENLADFLDTGVDFISVGSLTHSAVAFDFSLLVE